jgi:putative hydrolase of the HAD superfamily
MGTWHKIRPKRIRLITMDVTGTIVSFRGTLEQHYVGAAAKCGVTGVDKTKISDAFGKAYKETCQAYPCFGSDVITAKQWWKECVVKSFRYAGVEMDEATEDQVFQRIYSTFGSNAAYEIFPDALPFLKWAQRSGLVCGVLSNADERYGDSILPMLGLTHDDLQFRCFSKDLKLEKPDARVFMSAIKAGEPFLLGGDPCDPSQVLHIGNDFRKDFEGARRAGIHSVLLDRYGETEHAAEWRRRGAVVHTDLLDVVEWLGRSNCKLG